MKILHTQDDQTVMGRGSSSHSEDWLTSTAPDREGDAPSGLPEQALRQASCTEHTPFKTKSVFLAEKPTEQLWYPTRPKWRPDSCDQCMHIATQRRQPKTLSPPTPQHLQRVPGEDKWRTHFLGHVTLVGACGRGHCTHCLENLAHFLLGE